MGLLNALSALNPAKAAWSPYIHVFLPLLIAPLFSYMLHSFMGWTPGQVVHGIVSRMPNGHPARRPYDWLFQLQTSARPTPFPLPMRLFSWLAAIVFVAGATAFLWMRDPSLRPYTVKTVPLFAPEGEAAKEWLTLPFYYATGAFPFVGTRNSDPRASLNVEFSLPYEKGPPQRFLGRISVYWRDLDSRLSITGPLTLPAPGTPAELRECVQGWLRCRSARKKLWETTLAKHFSGRTLTENAWFTVENAFLTESERPQGLYLRSRPERGMIREAYFLVGPRMAVQGLILDRPDRAEGETASARLLSSLGSFRVSSDLAAPRAFLNPKLAKLRIGPKSSVGELIQAEGLLLAKVSIEPKDAESFYHLAGLAVTLYRSAKREGRIELAASSKTIVASSLRYAQDVDAKSRRIPEMQRFVTETESN